MLEKKNDIYQHKSVLTKEVVQYLNLKPNGLYIDATFGGGGHTTAILEAEPTCKVIALDWDKHAVEINAGPLIERFGERLTVVWSNFATLYQVLKKEKIKQVDGILADFGTSQYQITSREGFSFFRDTALDMRMSNAHSHVTAADLIATSSAQELADIFFMYGEESNAKKIAHAIVETRQKSAITTTKHLADLIEKLLPGAGYRGSGKRTHPATKVFQALRIFVNHELDHIETFLKATPSALAPHGRLVCISFHSLEDRLVKNFLKQSEHFSILTPKPITATDEELHTNQSARSAKLRAGEKLANNY